MAVAVKVQAMGSLWESTAQAVAIAKQAVIKEKEEKRKRNILLSQNAEREETMEYNQQNSIVDKMVEIKEILTKAGLGKVFPFKPERNKEGEIIGFVPKGKNDKEIKENIEEYKIKMQEALEAGKIDQEEFDKLEENLDELMKENNIELEEKEEIKVTDQEIMDNIKAFIMHNYGNKEEFAKECENYEELSLEDRKFKLQDVNSKINTQLGIVGDLHFSTNPNLKFENSFFNKDPGGYYLTEKEVQEKGLGPALYTMMEKSMMRQVEQQRGEIISPEKKKAMHEKILQEKKKREQEQKRIQDKADRDKAQAARKYMRNMWNG